MRLSAAAAMAASLAALGLAAPVRAQHVEYRASVTATGAYSQSLGGAGTMSQQNALAGPTVAFSPSLIALVDTLRTDNTFTYAFSLNVPFTQKGTVSPFSLLYSNRLSYGGHYALSELTTMTFGAAVTESPLNTFIPSQNPAEAPVQVTPAGVAYMLNFNGTEGFSRQVSELSSFTQNGSFTLGYPIDPTSIRARTFSGSNSFGVARSFFKDSLGVTLTNQFNYFTASKSAETVTTSRSAAPITTSEVTNFIVTLPSQTWVNTLALNWSHPFTERLSSTLIAGVTQTLSPGQATLMHVQPSGTATLNYNFLLATASLSYAHAAAPNVTTGTVNFTDSATARFSMPIGLTGLVTTGSAGYTYSTPIGTPIVLCPGNLPNCSAAVTATSPSHVIVADAALDYHPERVPTLTVGLRGQITRQVLTEDTSAANDFTRYTISLNLTYSYPNANAAAVRPHLSPLFSAEPPPSSEIMSTDRVFGAPTGGPAPEEPLPLPAGE
jgi:hypothetical protein